MSQSQTPSAIAASRLGRGSGCSEIHSSNAASSFSFSVMANDNVSAPEAFICKISKNFLDP